MMTWVQVVKRQSQLLITILLRTTLTRTINLHYYMLPTGSNYLLNVVYVISKTRQDKSDQALGCSVDVSGDLKWITEQSASLIYLHIISCTVSVCSLKIVELFFEAITSLKGWVVIFWKNHYDGIRLFSNSSLEMREFLSVKYIYHNFKTLWKR